MTGGTTEAGGMIGAAAEATDGAYLPHQSFPYFVKGMICCAWLCSDVSADAVRLSDECRDKSDTQSQRQMSCDLCAGILAHAPKALGDDDTAAETGDVSRRRSLHYS